MGRPSKPVTVIEAEGRSHRTKAELEERRKQESALLTGKKMQEWKATRENKIAHQEFQRVKKLLESIEKNDALHESTINRYAMLRAECDETENRRKRLENAVEELHENMGEMEFTEYIKSIVSLEKQITENDKNLMSKRRMMLDIEKENLMTISSAMRSIPKKPQSDESDEDPMAGLLGGGP